MNSRLRRTNQGDDATRRDDRGCLGHSRIPAEHAIAAIKWWRILQRFTGRRDALPETIRAVTGLASDRAAAR